MLTFNVLSRRRWGITGCTVVRAILLGAASIHFAEAESQSGGISTPGGGLGRLTTSVTSAETILPWSTSTSPSPSPSSTYTASSTSDVSPTWSQQVVTPTPAPFLGKPADFQFPLDPAARSYHELLKLFLCQTNATGTDNANTSNTWVIAQLLDCPAYRACTTNELVNTFGNEAQQWTFGFDPLGSSRYDLYSGYFFCFGVEDPGLDCRGVSEYFDILPGDGGTAPQSIMRRIADIRAATTTILQPSSIPWPTTTPALPLFITQSKDYLTYAGQPSTRLSVASSSSTIGTSSSTAVPSPTATSTTPTASSSTGGLSTGAKVGIALGAIALAALLLLLVFFCLRRKHSRRSKLEPIHESSSLHTDSFPPNTALIAEKDTFSPSSLTAIQQRHLPDTNTHTNTNAKTQTTTTTTSTSTITYSPLSSQPPSTNINLSAIPKRKPPANTTTDTTTSTIPAPITAPTTTASTTSPPSRGLSTLSRSSGGGASAITNNFDSYRDVEPTYGDARQSPQVFAASRALREEGMTPEEVARLEEEERRIDAAIAAAEAEGR